MPLVNFKIANYRSQLSAAMAESEMMEMTDDDDYLI
jgi:hypothetical protein